PEVGERRHLRENAGRAPHEWYREATAGAFAEPQVEIEERVEAEVGERRARAGLDGAMAGDAAVAHARDERFGDEERGAGNHSVDDNRNVCRGSADDETRQRRDLETAHLGEHRDGIEPPTGPRRRARDDL